MANTVLLVEDNIELSALVADILRRLDYKIVGQVRSGEEAIRRARQQQPDLLIMDIRLAGDLTGFEAGAQIRAGRPIPIIYTSSNADLMAQKRAAQPARTAFLAKPALADDFRAAIEQLLGPEQSPPGR